MRRLAIVGVPAAYRRGLVASARDRGWAVTEEDGADVTVTSLRDPAECATADQLVATGTVVLALVSPLGREEMAHALGHGAIPTDWDADPERILDAAEAALRGDVLLPVGTVHLLAPSAGTHQRDPLITRDEAEWLIALSRGTTVVRLADDAGYSERAMFRRLADLYARLGAGGRTEALLAAERLGLLDGRS